MKIAASLGESKATCLSPQEVIHAKTLGEIEAYISGRGKTRIHAGARNLSLNVSDDYGNRFLVELIQNAHDAHDRDRNDGEIAIVLDVNEGEYGCLYVANRGNGFSKENFEAITNIALSSKAVNESIGNKGLGFRSVLQICLWPEIYSVLGVGGQGMFDGYCFRFADVESIEGLLGGQFQRAMATEILENMPCWYLPVYADARPGLVNQFAKEGYAAVVRMPLESGKAREAVVAQINELLALKTPLHLFLDRISRIRIQQEPGNAESLERKVVDRWALPDGVLLEKLTIGTDDYLVAATKIDPDVFRTHLNASLVRKEVPEAWGDWRGSARVSVAIRLQQSIERGLLYCFLPLGEAGAAPFSGYINANFYTKMDRRSVNDGIGLNRYFISEAVSLSCKLIEFLIDQNWDESPGAVADLLCWKGSYAEVVRQYFEKDEGGILESPLLPICAVDGQTQWAKPSETCIWEVPHDACLSAEAVTREGDTAILLDTLSLTQKVSLEKFFGGMGVNFLPKPSTVADWVERVAQQMFNTKVPPERWSAFYDEVAHHLRGEASALFGKRFLLSVNGELISSEPMEVTTKRRRSADIYFPPVMAGDADSDDVESKSLLPLELLPARLKRGFALLSRDVSWLNADGGYRPARTFFLEAKLVREYDTRDVIRTLAGVTQSDVADTTKNQALEWAFRLWSSGRSLSEKETRATKIFVPMRGGWGSAETAMFGNGWAVTHGKRLELMLKAGAEYSHELASVRENLLQSFGEWPIKYGSEEEWIHFLLAAGVRDCLRPFGGEERIQLDGQPYYLPDLLADSVKGLSESAISLWRSALIESARHAKFSSVQYRSELHPWRLPGQVDLEHFSTELRRDYALQIVRALNDLKIEHLKFRIFRPGNPSSGPVPEVWPTPLFSLLNDLSWLPVIRGASLTRFVAPKDAWHFDTEDDAPPRFMELVAPQVAKAFDDETLERLRKDFGLRLLNNERDAIQALSAYGDTAANVLSDMREVRRFRELFGEVWTLVAPLDSGVELNSIPVMVGGEVRALCVNPSERDEAAPETVCYLIDEENAAKRQLLEELAQPLFDFGTADPEDNWGWLEALAPGRFMRVSNVQLEVHVDGVRFEDSVSAPLLTEVFGSWIADFIVCAAEHKGGAFFKRTQNNLGKVKRAALALRICTGKHLQISMGGVIRDLPESLRGAVVLRQNNYAILIAQTTESEPSLDLLSCVSEQLALALQQRDIANGLDASFLRLAQLMSGSEHECPDDEDIAQALGIGVHILEQTRRYTRANLTTHIRLAVLLAACFGLESSQRQLTQLIEEDEPSEESVLVALKPISDARGTTVAHLVEQLGLVSDLRELMQIFELSLTNLNDAVKRLDGDFRPISNEDLHNRQLKAYLSQRSVQITEGLRNSFVDIFDRGENLSEYVRVRDAVGTIQPDPEWFEQFNDLPDSLLDAHVASWRSAQGIPEAAVTSNLPSLQESREVNAARLREFWGRYGKVLSAWVRHEFISVPQSLRDAWTDPGANRQEYWVLAHKSGWLDFQILDDSTIAKWLESHGLWPSGKPVSTVFSDWGLSEENVRDGEKQVEREREAQRKRKLQVTFEGRDYSALDDDCHDLIAAVKVSLQGSDALADINASIRSLVDIEEPRRGGGTSNGGPGGKGRMPSSNSSLSNEQKKSIGLIGEIWAREWIKRFHQEKHGIELDDSCWVSKYRDTVLGTNSGNDNLGYDYVVRLKSTTFFYEVKASTGDSGSFEMGPTEIGAAQRYKSDKENKFRVLYVAYATDPKHTTFSLLPNPFSREGMQKLRVVGRGSVTYEFGIVRKVQ